MSQLHMQSCLMGLCVAMCSLHDFSSVIRKQIHSCLLHLTIDSQPPNKQSVCCRMLKHV